MTNDAYGPLSAPVSSSNTLHGQPTLPPSPSSAVGATLLSTDLRIPISESLMTFHLHHHLWHSRTPHALAVAPHLRVPVPRDERWIREIHFHVHFRSHSKSLSTVTVINCPVYRHLTLCVPPVQTQSPLVHCSRDAIGTCHQGTPSDVPCGQETGDTVDAVQVIVRGCQVQVEDRRTSTSPVCS